MTQIQFDGQQSDEQILFVARPHPMAKWFAIARVVALAILFYLILMLISSVVPKLATFLQFGGLLLSLLLITAGIWWNTLVHAKSKTYLTDRRIFRIEVASPFFQTKRALFWTEALKAKGYAPNMIYRLAHVGTVEVEPHLSSEENVRITEVYLFEDLANYIDKILFTVKNRPDEMSSMHPFIPKPRGERG